jgi:uncharacterized protein YdaU (DUF1376 family)
MNFYKHHIGDYAAATAHLSILEDGVFRRLLTIYYRDEKPLPADMKTLQRLVGARSKDEREAVVDVVGEFFALDGEVYRNKRCDEEIAKAASQAETNRRIAEEREARRKRTKGTPAENEPLHDSLPEQKHDSLRSREPSHKPDSRQELYSPERSSGRTRDARPHAPADDGPQTGRFEGHDDPRPAPPNPAAPFAIALNRIGARCTAMNPDLAAYVAAKGTVEHLIQVAELPECAGKPAAYIARFALRELTQPAATTTTGTRHEAHRKPRLGLADRHPPRRPGPDDAIDGEAVRIDD